MCEMVSDLCTQGAGRTIRNTEPRCTWSKSPDPSNRNNTHTHTHTMNKHTSGHTDRNTATHHTWQKNNHTMQLYGWGTLLKEYIAQQDTPCLSTPIAKSVTHTHPTSKCGHTQRDIHIKPHIETQTHTVHPCAAWRGTAWRGGSGRWHTVDLPCRSHCYSCPAHALSKGSKYIHEVKKPMAPTPAVHHIWRRSISRQTWACAVWAVNNNVHPLYVAPLPGCWTRCGRTWFSIHLWRGEIFNDQFVHCTPLQTSSLPIFKRPHRISYEWGGIHNWPFALWPIRNLAMGNLEATSFQFSMGEDFFDICAVAFQPPKISQGVRRIPTSHTVNNFWFTMSDGICLRYTRMWWCHCAERTFSKVPQSNISNTIAAKHRYTILLRSNTNMQSCIFMLCFSDFPGYVHL